MRWVFVTMAIVLVSFIALAYMIFFDDRNKR